MRKIKNVMKFHLEFFFLYKSMIMLNEEAIMSILDVRAWLFGGIWEEEMKIQNEGISHFKSYIVVSNDDSV